MEALHPSVILDGIKKYISVLKTQNGKYFFATQNNDLLDRKELFTSDEQQFEFFDVKFGHKRQIYFKDVTDIYLISFPEEYSPPMGKDISEEKDLFLEISKKYVERINLLDKQLFKYTVNDKKFETVFNLIRYNEILSYYDIKLDFIDKQILFFDEGITDKFLGDQESKICDKDGNLKLTLTNTIILSFFDKKTQEYILEDDNLESRFTKLKSLYLYLLNSSREKTIKHLETEKNSAIKDLKGIEKNYVIENFDLEIQRLINKDIEKDLSYIDNEHDLILYWPFSLDLSVGNYVVTVSPEKNRGTGKIILYSVANSPFFNLYKVFKEYLKTPMPLKTFEFLKDSNVSDSVKKELISKKLQIFEKKKDEIFEFLNNEYNSTDNVEIKNDIDKLREEISSSITQFNNEITPNSSIPDILRYWPTYLYPIPEELVVE